LLVFSGLPVIRNGEESERDDEYETERDEYLNHSLDILEQNRRKKAI